MEQIIFSKMLLFSSVYHHHKIRALECGVRSMFRRIWADPSRMVHDLLRFPTIGSMLRVTDDEFWALARREPQLVETVEAMTRRRELPMRALAVNIATIDQTKVEPALYIKYQELSQFPGQQRAIGDIIYNRLAREHQPSKFGGVWLDFPKTPKVSSDAQATLVDRGDDYVGLELFFPTPQWVAAYTDNKLTAHVFFDPPVQARRAVAALAREYFENEYKVTCKDLAEEACFKDDNDEAG